MCFQYYLLDINVTTFAKPKICIGVGLHLCNNASLRARYVHFFLVLQCIIVLVHYIIISK